MMMMVIHLIQFGKYDAPYRHQFHQINNNNFVSIVLRKFDTELNPQNCATCRCGNRFWIKITIAPYSFTQRDFFLMHNVTLMSLLCWQNGTRPSATQPINALFVCTNLI